MISILVPTLNEADNIPLLINDLKKINFEFELIIIDDNSTDNTSEVIKKYLNEKIRFIKRVSKNRDLSKSIILGAKKSKFDYIVILAWNFSESIIFKLNKTFKKRRFKIIIPFPNLKII